MIRMISSILSFETNKVNPFPTLRASTPLLAIASPHLFFFSNLCNADEVDLVANIGKISLAKGTARSISAFLPKLPITLPRNPPYGETINLYKVLY